MSTKPDYSAFNRPAKTGREEAFVREAIHGKDLTEGPYVEKCRGWLEKQLGCEARLTSSCTHALEMAALLLNMEAGDEIIMPSFTFVSAANAFVIHGGVPVFIDIRPDTMNMDEKLIEQAITPRTRAIMVMHYGGVSCDMDAITRIAQKHKLPIIEDAAHGLMAKWKGRYLGTLGTIGTFSFHQTKNFTSGEGGAIVLHEPALVERADIVRHKGTNRTAFMQQKASFYNWVDVGSSWTIAELCAAYLYGNLLGADDILAKRRATWQTYEASLDGLQKQGLLTLPVVPEGCEHNAHLFYIRVKDKHEREKLIAYLKEQGVNTVFHYVPLHSSPAGKRFGRMSGEDKYTTIESERLLRLPLFYNMPDGQAEYTVAAIHRFYGK